MDQNVLTQDQTNMKLSNLTTIFHLLYDHAPISRADLAKLSGMSPTSITRFVNNMQAVNLISETLSTQKKVGRTATMLDINKDAILSVGINIDASYTHVSILNFRQEFIANRYKRIEDGAPSLEYVLDLAYTLYRQALEDAGLTDDQICGIGVSITGPISRSAILEFTPQLKWKGINIREALQKRFQHECVIVENDCNSSLLGQCVLHPEYKKYDVACLLIGSGVGSSVTYRGALFTQPTGISFSEIGHTTIDPNGMVCDCGNRGCLQTFIAEKSLLLRAQESDPSIRTMDQLYRAWNNGVPWARALLRQACAYGRIAINNVACMYNPQIVLIGGTSIDHYWDMFAEMVTTPPTFFEPLKGNVQIIPFFKVHRSSILGVSQQVQERYLNTLLESTL